MINLRRMKRAGHVACMRARRGHVACMGERRGVYMVLVGRPKERSLLGRT